MKSRVVLNILAVSVLILTTFAEHAVAKAAKPDIVYILADDLGYNDVGFTGGKEIKTPNIDKLAAAGTILNQFYVQPVCTPTRAALMTGRYPMRYGLQVGVIIPAAQYGLPLEEQLLPVALHDAGYSTFILGKWHLGEFDKAYWPTARGFDHHYGLLCGAIDYFTHMRDGKLEWFRDGQLLNEEGYTTHLLAADAVRVVRSQSKEKPLFLYLPFNAVHGPFQAPIQYKEPYGDLKEQRRTYAGMVAAMDEAVGKIVNAIEETGRRKNTLFIFSSDNGGPAPGKITDNGIFRAGKGTLYEGGVRVCAFATWEDKIKPGTHVDEPMHVIDWYPTLLKLTGAYVDQKLPLDGRDIWPTIAEKKRSPHEEILLNSRPGSGAIRIGNWKLVINGSVSEIRKQQPGKTANNKIELFNLRDDPREQKNVAATNLEKLKELRGRYEALAKQAVPPKKHPSINDSPDGG